MEMSWPPEAPRSSRQDTTPANPVAPEGLTERSFDHGPQIATLEAERKRNMMSDARTRWMHEVMDTEAPLEGDTIFMAPWLWVGVTHIGAYPQKVWFGQIDMLGSRRAGVFNMDYLGPFEVPWRCEIGVLLFEDEQRSRLLRKPGKTGTVVETPGETISFTRGAIHMAFALQEPRPIITQPRVELPVRAKQDLAAMERLYEMAVRRQGDSK